MVSPLIGNTGSSNSSASNTDYTALLRQVQKKPLNASRAVKISKAAYGQKDGAPILDDKDALLPRTGIATVDQYNQKVTSATQFTQEAVRDVATSTIYGSIYGGICGQIIGAWREAGGSLLKIFEKRLAILAPTRAALIFGFTGAMGGGVLACVQSIHRNWEAAKELFKKPSTENADSASPSEVALDAPLDASQASATEIPAEEPIPAESPAFI